VPSLDLRFADNKSLVDAVTGASLVTFTRASSGTFVDSAGVLQTAATDAPRFDHNPTTGESLGLLVEEQRTNLLVRSEEFDDAAWSIIRATVNANVIAAPDSATTADKLVENTQTGPHHANRPALSFTSGTVYTLSGFYKAAERTRVALQFGIDGAPFPNQANHAAFFDLSTGTIVFTGSSVTSTITALANGWYRCTVTATAQATATDFVFAGFLVSTGTTFSYTGDGTSGIYLWGAQLEAGASPTSYIPTTDAAVTRSADLASITGSAFSSWYRQDEGTVFAQTQVAEYSSTANPELVALFGADLVNDRINLFVAGASPNYRVVIRAGGADQFLQNVVALANIYDVNNSAIAYKENDSVSYGRNANTTDTSVTLPVITSLNFSAAVSVTKYIRRICYWNQRLANSTLENITQ
jgi:hypothetical protein